MPSIREVAISDLALLADATDLVAATIADARIRNRLRQMAEEVRDSSRYDIAERQRSLALSP